MIEHSIRPFVKTDWAFVHNAWYEDFRRNADFSHNIPNSIYGPCQTALIKLLLQRSSVLVICDPQDQDSIFGFIVFELINNQLLIHWLHIKELYRKQGLSKTLLSQLTKPKELPIYCSHLTKMLKPLIKTYQIRYNPYYLQGMPLKGTT